jgi:hypothetical protein
VEGIHGLRGHGPGGKMTTYQGVWAGSAQREKRHYWTKTMGGQVVTIPGVRRWGEIDPAVGKAEWEDVPAIHVPDKRQLRPALNYACDSFRVARQRKA